MITKSLYSVLTPWYKGLYERIEAFRVSRILQRNHTVLNLVYDYNASPPTYGDLIAVIMLARYLKCRGAFINFIFLNDSFRKDWLVLDERTRELRMEEHYSLVKTLLSSDAEVSKMSYSQLVNEVNSKNLDSSNFVFFDRTLNRKPLYRSSWNLLNLIYRDKFEDDDDFLLTSYELRNSCNFNIPKQEFISWHCRKSNKESSQARNTREEEFFQVYFELEKLHPNKILLIVSDEHGCNYYRNLAAKENLKLLFSKDYSDSFLGDGFLILNSSFHFISRGGGIDMFSLFSNNPYQAYVNCISEKPWSEKKAHPWSNDMQLFYDINSLKDTYLPSDDLSFKKMVY